MRIARVEYRGAISTVVIDGDRVEFVRGEPYEELERTGKAARLSEVRLLAPTKPSKILAMAVNYRSHAGDRPPPEKPEAFLKAPSSLIGPGEAIELPAGSERVDEEGEVVAVISRRARNITEDEVDDYVLGYTCGNDVSARDWQRGDTQWWRGKSSDTFTAVGPWIETDIDPSAIAFGARVNGKVEQDANTSELVFSIRECIAFISSAMTLEPGDLVFTGTPGVTAQLHPGDVVDIEVEGIGVLSNPVVAADPARRG